MGESKRSRLSGLLSPIPMLFLALIVAMAAVGTLAVLSYTSISGLTVRISGPSRTCPLDSTTDAKVVTYSLTAIVYSTQSLHTSLSQVQFQLSAGNYQLGTLSGPDRAFDPGQGTSYYLVFKNPAPGTGSLPTSVNLVLAITAQVSAGIYSMKMTASDSETYAFPSTC